MDQQNNPINKPNSGNPSWHKKKRRRNHHNNKPKTQNGADQANLEALNNSETVEEKDTCPHLDNIDISIKESLEKDSESTMFGTDPDAVEVTVTIENEEEVKMIRVAGIRFKPNGKIYFFDNANVNLKTGGHAIVDTARGLEYGEVAFADKEVKESMLVLPLRSVVRAATKEDAEKNKQNKQKEEEAFKICLEKITAHKLNMINRVMNPDNKRFICRSSQS